MDARESFASYTDEPILESQDCSDGQEQIVTRIRTASGTFILKRPREHAPTSVNCESFASRSWSGIAPRIVYLSEEFIIQDCLAGAPLFNPSFEQYADIGRLMRRMHTVPMTGHGPVIDGKGRFSSQQEYVDFILMKWLPRLRQTGIFSGEELALAERYLRDNVPAIDSSFLIHFDMGEGHIFAENGRITGVIDFSSIQSGSPMEDFHYFYLLHYGTQRWEELIKGYGEVDMAQIEYYALLNLTWRIAMRYERKKLDKRMERMKMLYRSIPRDSRLRRGT